jgi:uncharacterized protein (UPF0333 family)
MRGQTAIEYMLIFSAMLGILAFVSIAQLVNPATDAANDSLYLSQAKSVVDAISGAIDSVCAEGPGAVNGVSFSIGSAWTLELDNENNKVRITIQTSDGEDNVEDNLRYNIDNYHSASLRAGIYIVAAVWSENDTVLENIDTGALENLDISEATDNKIYIYIRPSGWGT